MNKSILAGLCVYTFIGLSNNHATNSKPRLQDVRHTRRRRPRDERSKHQQHLNRFASFCTTHLCAKIAEVSPASHVMPLLSAP